MGYVMPKGLTRDERLRMIAQHSWDRHVRARARHLLAGADTAAIRFLSWRFMLFGSATRREVEKESDERRQA